MDDYLQLAHSEQQPHDFSKKQHWEAPLSTHSNHHKSEPVKWIPGKWVAQGKNVTLDGKKVDRPIKPARSNKGGDHSRRVETMSKTGNQNGGKKHGEGKAKEPPGKKLLNNSSNKFTAEKGKQPLAKKSVNKTTEGKAKQPEATTTGKKLINKTTGGKTRQSQAVTPEKRLTSSHSGKPAEKKHSATSNGCEPEPERVPKSNSEKNGHRVGDRQSQMDHSGTNVQKVTKPAVSPVANDSVRSGNSCDHWSSVRFFDRDLFAKYYQQYRMEAESGRRVHQRTRISFIIAHHNRPELLFLTLCSLSRSKSNNFEVVVVDDRSDQTLELVEEVKFPFPIKIIKIARVANDYSEKCPGEVYNLAFEHSVGDIIAIQNPECFHLGDIPRYINRSFKRDDYLSFPCFNSGNIKVNDYILENPTQARIGTIERLTQSRRPKDQGILWYQHPVRNNRNLHFCTAISRDNFEFLGGFSQDYSRGFCFEDDDLLFRIKHVLKLNVKSVTVREVGVVHLFHGKSVANGVGPDEPTVYRRSIYERFALNQSIFEHKRLVDKKIAVPKIVHYYWDDFKNFSYMNLYSLKTAVHYHPDYLHLIWCPTDPSDRISWEESCHKDVEPDPSYPDYFDAVKRMPNVRIVYRDMSEFLGVDKGMSEVHKSDLLRYKLLYLYGGIWSDLDIVYIKPLTSLIDYDFDTINFRCRYSNSDLIYFPVGLMMSKRGSQLFRFIYEEAIKNYNESMYQCFGSELFKKLFSGSKFSIHGNRRYLVFNSEKNVFLDEAFYLKYNWTKIGELFLEEPKNSDLSDVVGFHWFNGSSKTRELLKETINWNIPDSYQGLLFRERERFHLKISKVVYFTFKFHNYAKYLAHKTKTYIELFKRHYVTKTNSETDTFFPEWAPEMGKLLFDVERDSLYLFDEMSYASLLIWYVKQKQQERDQVINFFKTANYICFFSELFCNENLQTIGNVYSNSLFAKSFFGGAKKVMLCNTKNWTYLIKNGIYRNLEYFPPLGYRHSYNSLPNTVTTKSIDVLFYGNIRGYQYRENILKKLFGSCEKIGIKMLTMDDLHGSEKDEIIGKTNIVVHVPSHPNLHTFPWAKTDELMCKKVFFIIEENEEMYIQNMENLVIFYKQNNVDDLLAKVKHYLDNTTERESIVEKCFEFIKQRYDMDKFIENGVARTFRDN
jgi:GT2 family glycosyltransferase